EAVLEMPVEIVDGGRLDDIEGAEQDKGHKLSPSRCGREPQHQPECHYLVPDHAAMVWSAQLAADALAGPAAQRESQGQYCGNGGVGQARNKQYPEQPAAQRAPCA